MKNDPEEEEKYPRDFELPFEDLDPEDSHSEALSLILDGSTTLPKGATVLSPEEFIIVSSTVGLYSAYVAYIKEMNPDLHKRAVEFSSDTVELHPNVVLTDGDGQPLGRFADQADEMDDDEEPPVGI